MEQINDNVLKCFAEMLIDYIDARISGNNKEAYNIKRKLTGRNLTESLVCHICKKVSNVGSVISEDGKLVWECSRCTNMAVIIKGTLFNRKEGN
jgi:hypothetical protein